METELAARQLKGGRFAGNRVGVWGRLGMKVNWQVGPGSVGVGFLVGFVFCDARCGKDHDAIKYPLLDRIS